jgi:hypothetical protein
MWVYYRVRYAGLDRFFTVALVLVGTVLLGSYVTAPETQIASRIEGFDIATNQRLIHLTQFALGLDVSSGDLRILGYWQYENTSRDLGRAFNLVFVLPFIIEAYYNSSFYTPKLKNWNVVNTNVTGVVASAVSVNFTKKDLLPNTGYFFAEFLVAHTYTNSHRGSYQILLPLDSPLDGPYFPALIPYVWKENVTGYTLADNNSVDITFPRDAANIQPFPQAKVGVTEDNTRDLVEWIFTQRTQLNLYYVNQDEQSTFEVYVILGSLLLGSGISGIADWLKDRSS